MRQGKKPTAKKIAPRQFVRLPLEPEPLETRCLLSASSCAMAHPDATFQAATTSAVQGYTPAQIRVAYGFNSVSATGSGQTIAVVDAFNDANIASDLKAFDAQFALAAPPSLKIVNQTGGNPATLPSDAGWASEAALDVEWAHAIAPAANLLLVETTNDSIANLLAGVNYARHAAGVSVVTMSWGISEFNGELSDDSIFTTPAGHNGVTFVAASGDSGARWGPDYPASCPNVIAVGGTTLSLNASTGAYLSESGWRDSTGGESYLETEPSYQLTAQSTGVRTTPDVAFDANPNTGFAVYDSVPYEGTRGWTVAGGTSAGTPQWGAMVALADQVRGAKLGSLNGATQTLPALYKPYASPTTYAASYHDITGSFRSGAGPGYDLLTGLGTPQAAAIVSQLAKAGTVATPAIQKPVPMELILVVRPQDIRDSDPNATAAPQQVTSAPGPAVEQPGIVYSVHQPPEAVQPPTQTAPQPAVAPPPPMTSAAPTGTATVSSASLPAVFHDTLIQQDIGAIALQDAPAIELAAAASSRQLGSGADAMAARWLGRTDGSLVTWMGVTGQRQAGSVFDDAFAALSSAASAMMWPACGAGPVLARASEGALVAFVSPTTPLPDQMLLRFANFDPTRTFADAMAAFAGESASLDSQPEASPAGYRAWAITGLVLGVDAMLGARWYASQQKSARKKVHSLTAPESPQAGLLPTGL